MMKDVYVVAGARTAVGKSKRGALATYRPDDMAAAAIADAVRRAGVKGEEIQDLVLGCSIPEGEQGMNIARMAGTIAGLPDSVSAMTINRFCSSGLEAMAIIAAKIEAGLLDVGIGGGVESMSMVPMPGFRVAPNPGLTKTRPDVFIAMGNAGDNVARDFGFTRQQIDEFALQSNLKAVDAIDKGYFKDQIVPLQVPNGNGKTFTFDTDEGPRRDTSMEALGALKPAFAISEKTVFHTAGNSSQTSDGAAALVLMSGKAVKERGLKPLARFVGYNIAAGEPKYLGPAQLEAIPRACELAGIKVSDVDLFEANEAFAAVVLLVQRELKIDPAKVNVNGGAIALGHPLGCSGAKLSVQIINELRRRGGKYGVVTMCIGGGMGGAGVFELCD